MDRSNLGYLGVDFQYRLISAFFEDADFFKDMYTIIDQNMFTDIHLKIIVGTMKDYYAKYNSVPSYSIIEPMLRQKSTNDADTQYFIEVLNKLKNTDTEGIMEIEEMSEKFFKQQNWVRVANEILRIAGDGDIEKYDRCHKLMEEAMSVSRNKERAYSPYDDVLGDLSSQNIISIPTGISQLDKQMGGGLDKGKIGLIIGSSGFGKTSMTTCIAHNAATTKAENNNFTGYKVVQFVFEDSKRDINRKYFSKISQVETCNLNKDEDTEKYVYDMVENNPDKQMMKNNIRVIPLKTGEYSATEIMNIIKRLTNEGFKPDMVIVDYFECVDAEKGTKALSKWEQEGKTMRVFENGAKELDIALWIPVQGNRDSINSELVTMDKAGGSIQKIQIAQVVLSITRTLTDIEEQKATLTLLKNRSGSAGITLNGIKFNNGTCTITCENVMSTSDALKYVDEQNEANIAKTEELKQALLK